MLVVALAANTKPSQALAALNEMRAMMKKQPGYLSKECLRHPNAGNAPRYVHVSRWASMTYWAALFQAPEFSKFSALGNKHYTISASAFLPAEWVRGHRTRSIAGPWLALPGRSDLGPRRCTHLMPSNHTTLSSPSAQAEANSCAGRGANRSTPTAQGM